MSSQNINCCYLFNVFGFLSQDLHQSNRLTKEHNEWTLLTFIVLFNDNKLCKECRNFYKKMGLHPDYIKQIEEQLKKV